jgi:hypothetical protein
MSHLYTNTRATRGGGETYVRKSTANFRENLQRVEEFIQPDKMATSLLNAGSELQTI